MSVAAVIIVKNEEAVLARALSSLEAIATQTMIFDTGSSDRTREIANLFGAYVREIPWKNFGATRTEAVAIACRESGCDYLLTIDADMEAVAEGPLPDRLEADAYYLPVDDGGPRYYLPVLLSTARAWRYVGTTHEYLDYIGPDRLERLVLRHHCDGSRRPTKNAEDLAALEAELAADPENPRVMFYLANTYRDLGRHDEAIPLYRRRALAGGWQPEAEKAALQAIRLEAGDATPVGVP